MIVLDTHVVLWLAAGSDRLGRRTRRLIDSNLRSDGVVVPAVVFWEVAMQAAKRRVDLDEPAAAFRRRTLGLGLREQPLDGEIAIAAVDLSGLHGDPADRFIAATAVSLGATLVTADGGLLKWGGPIKVQDATR
jgi:PIN domain nuclease of toxin-antitoxin system